MQLSLFDDTRKRVSTGCLGLIRACLFAEHYHMGCKCGAGASIRDQRIYGNRGPGLGLGQGWEHDDGLEHLSGCCQPSLWTACRCAMIVLPAGIW